MKLIPLKIIFQAAYSAACGYTGAPPMGLVKRGVSGSINLSINNTIPRSQIHLVNALIMEYSPRVVSCSHLRKGL